MQSPIPISDNILPLSDSLTVSLPNFDSPDAYVVSIYHTNTYQVRLENLVDMLFANWLYDYSGGDNCEDALPADLNFDCKVDIEDFGLMVPYWENVSTNYWEVDMFTVGDTWIGRSRKNAVSYCS